VYKRQVISYVMLAHYIMRHEEAYNYIADHLHIAAELRKYTNYLFATNSSILSTLYEFDELLRTLCC
jgi:hypothetical protein